MSRVLFDPNEQRAYEQLLRRQLNPSEHGSQRVAQWEVDALATMVTKLLMIVGSPGSTMDPDGKRISITMDSYREMNAMGERLKLLEQWAKAEGVEIRQAATSGVSLQLGDNAVIVTPTLAECVDVHVMAGR